MTEKAYRQHLLNEFETAEDRTEQLLLRLAAMPDEQSRYDYLSSERRDEIFVTDGYYWRMTDWFWFYSGKDKDMGYPVALVGMAGAKKLRGTLKLPAQIALPGLTFTVVNVEGYCLPVSSGDFQNRVKCEVYDDINLRGLDVSSLIIPDSVVILKDLSDYQNITTFRFPRTFWQANGNILCNCPKLTAVEFAEEPLAGFANYFRNCPSLQHFILPDIGWLHREHECYDGMNQDSEWIAIDYYRWFETRRNPASHLPVKIEVHGAKDLLSEVVLPDRFEETAELADFLQSCPEYFSEINSLTMPSGIRWDMEDEYPDTDEYALDYWTYGGENDRLWFPISRCTNLESLILPDTLRRLPSHAFMDNHHLREVRLSAVLESIGDFAFAGLSRLTHIEIPATVRRIGEYAFAGTSLSEITLPAACTLAEEAIPAGVRIHRR